MLVLFENRSFDNLLTSDGRNVVAFGGTADTQEPTRIRQRPRRGLQAGAALMVGAGALVICGLPSVAGAAAPTTSTFTLTGSVSGTLTMANGPATRSGGTAESSRTTRS